jgi:hypothetical protein
MKIFKIILYILCPCIKQKDNIQPLESTYTSPSPQLNMKLFNDDIDEDNENEREEYFYYF